VVLPISSRQDNMQPYYDVASLQTYKDIDPVNARLDGISDSKPWWFGEEAKLRPGVRIWWMPDDWCSARCLFQSCAWSGRIHTWNSWMRCDHILWLPIIQVIQVSEAKPYEAHMIAESRCELGGISFGPQAFDGLQRQRDLVCCILIWVNVCQKYPEIMLSIPKAVFSAPFISFSA